MQPVSAHEQLRIDNIAENTRKLEALFGSQPTLKCVSYLIVLSLSHFNKSWPSDCWFLIIMLCFVLQNVHMFCSNFISEPLRKIKKAGSIFEASGTLPLRRSSRLSQVRHINMGESDDGRSASDYSSSGYSNDSDAEETTEVRTWVANRGTLSSQVMTLCLLPLV